MAKRVIKDENGKTYVEKKPVYKRIWFWILMGALLGIINLAVNGGKSEQPKPAAVHSVKATESEPTKTDDSESSEASSNSGVSQEFKSALAKANSYSKTLIMSKAGIYDQLTSDAGEKFPADAANYAVENVDADWNANALKKAKSYQKTMNMSNDAIRDQLTSEAGEKFTPEQADYAINNLNK